MPGRMVVVREFESAIEAEVARSLLESAGITAFVFKDDAGGMCPSMQRWAGVRLIVGEEDAAIAHDILVAYSAEEELENPQEEE